MYAQRNQSPLDAVRVVLDHPGNPAAGCTECETRVAEADRIEREIPVECDLSAEQRARPIETLHRRPVRRTLHAQVQAVTQAANGDALDAFNFVAKNDCCISV